MSPYLWPFLSLLVVSPLWPFLGLLVVGASLGGVCLDCEEESSLVQFKSIREHRSQPSCGDPSWFYNCTQPGTEPYPTPCPEPTTFEWCDTNRSAAERAELLVAELNLTELAEQVSCDIFGGVPAIKRLRVNSYNFIREMDHGLLWNNVCPIPTVFPVAIVMGAAFNRTLWTAIGKAGAREARYNFHWGKQNGLFLQTNFNIYLDPRWGRGQEVPSECPFHTAEYAAAWAAGVQAPEGPDGKPLAALSCKHFTAYSLEGAGGWPFPAWDQNRHNFNAVVTQQELADTHFPVYKTCAEVGAKGMMSAYNAVNGVPMAANGNLTNGIAREKWGFKGAVVTDCGAVQDVWLRHKYVPTPAEAATAALKGGTDIECGNTIKQSGATVENEALLRQAVQRSFQVRMELGEFDPPSPGVAAMREMYDEAAHARLAFEAAVQGSVLLRNEVLPLRSGTKIALLGPMKDVNWELLGSYTGYKDAANWSDSPNVVTIKQGLEECGMVGELVEGRGTPYICSVTDDFVPGTQQFPEKPDADVAVIAAGIYCQDEVVQDVDVRPYESQKCQAGCLEVEGCDKPGLAWPKGQEMLIERALTWDMPLVLIIVSGTPVDLSMFDKHKGPVSILWVGYPGQQAGTAIAQMLFGYESPSGKLPFTWYTESYGSQLSMKDLQMRAEKRYPGRTYRFVRRRYVAIPYGFGLSYNTWNFQWSEATSPTDWGCSIGLTVTLKEAVTPNPSETILLFLKPRRGKRWGAPRKVLRRFQRVTGDTTLQFDLLKKDFMLADDGGEFQLLEGRWIALIGSPSILRQRLEVRGRGCRLL